MALIRSHLLKYILASVRRLLQLLQAPTLDRPAIADEALYLRLAIQFGPANLSVHSLTAPRWKVANPAKSNLGLDGKVVLNWDDPELAERLEQVVKAAVTITDHLNSPPVVANTADVLELLLKSARETTKKSPPSPPPSAKRRSQPDRKPTVSSGEPAKKRNQLPTGRQRGRRKK